MVDDRNYNLSGTPVSEYAGDYAAHLLEQYKLYVEMADRISHRRQTANTFFLTVNTALVALLDVAFRGESDLAQLAWYPLVSFAGVVLAFTWYRLIHSYRDLNTVKFRLVRQIERRLPIRPYEAEWQALGQGEESRLYLPFTSIETKVPWVFMLLYVALLVASYLD